MRQRTQWQPTESKKITSSTCDRELRSNVYKELKKLNIDKTTQVKNKWSTVLKGEFSTKESLMFEKHLRKCSTSLVVREMQIKTTLAGFLLIGTHSLCWLFLFISYSSTVSFLCVLVFLIPCHPVLFLPRPRIPS